MPMDFGILGGKLGDNIQFAKPPAGDQTEAHTTRVPAPPVHGGGGGISNFF